MEVGNILGWISLSMPRAQCREKWMMRGGGGDEERGREVLIPRGVISCHHQVSYIDIKRWRKSQNITWSLLWVALHFLIFQLIVNESWEKSEQNSISLMSCTPFPDFSAQRLWKFGNWFPYGNELMFSTKLIHHILYNKESGSYCCWFLTTNLNFSILSWTRQLTGNWKHSNADFLFRKAHKNLRHVEETEPPCVSFEFFQFPVSSHVQLWNADEEIRFFVKENNNNSYLILCNVVYDE